MKSTLKLSLLLILLVLLTSFAYASDALSQSSMSRRQVSKNDSTASEIIEWSDHRDGTSEVEVECSDGHRVIVTPIDNKRLKRIDLRKFFAELDKECQRDTTGQSYKVNNGSGVRLRGPSSTSGY